MTESADIHTACLRQLSYLYYTGSIYSSTIYNDLIHCLSQQQVNAHTDTLLSCCQVARLVYCHPAASFALMMRTVLDSTI